MTAALETAVMDSKNEGHPIPENGSFRESSNAQGRENGHTLAVSFAPPATRFRESSNKPPRRVPNSGRRSREFLTPAEVESLINAAEKLGRHGHRDATMLMIAYRHALRVSELVSLRWDQIDLGQGQLHVKRLKNGNPSTHPLHGPELRALRRLQWDYPDCPLRVHGRAQRPVD